MTELELLQALQSVQNLVKYLENELEKIGA